MAPVRTLTLAVIFSVGSLSAMSTNASALCLGNCGTENVPDGVVTLPGTYSYVTTSGGLAGAGQIPGVGGTNGSSFTTDPFSAVAGAPLDFSFQYITSDGAGFADYAFASLTSLADPTNPIYLFTARTEPSGSIVPGVGLPSVAATLNPSSVEIIGGGPIFSGLGFSSGQCYSTGCGYTSIVSSTYSVQSKGLYTLTFGVSNFSDTAYDSALAFNNVTIDSAPISIGGVPEPSTWAMMLIGLGGVGLLAHRKAQKRGSSPKMLVA